MLRSKSLERFMKYKRDDPDTGTEFWSSGLESEIAPEDIELVKVDEGNGNWHYDVKIKNSSNYN